MKKTVWTVVTAALLVWGATASAAVISDDFEDGVIDPVLWNAQTPGPNMTVNENSGVAKLHAGGWLGTNAEFAPTGGGPLEITSLAEESRPPAHAADEAH